MKQGLFRVILNDLLLKPLTFRKEFTEAVETTQVTQKEALRAKGLVERTKQQQKAAIISSEGDFNAAELIPNTLVSMGNGLIELCKRRTSPTRSHILKTYSENITYVTPVTSVLQLRSDKSSQANKATAS